MPNRGFMSNGFTTSSPHASNDHDAIVEWSGLGGWYIKFEWN